MAPDRQSLLTTLIPLGTGDARLALVTLNRPEQMNPIDHGLVLELRDVLRELSERPEVRVLAFTGAGAAFSAGGDMKRYMQLQRDPVAFRRFVEDLHEVFTSITRLAVPAVALLNGFTLAGGLELALSCDFAIAGQSARIGDAHLPYGQMGGGGVLSRLPRAIGAARARELIFTGRLLSAADALGWGLVNSVVADDQLIDAGVSFGREVAAKSPLAVANAKRVLNEGVDRGGDLGESLRNEIDVTVNYCLTSHDAPEGLEAFAAKRAPSFTGR